MTIKTELIPLQIDALLPRIQPSSSRTPPLEAFLLKLHEHIMAIKSVSPKHPLEAARKLEKKGVVVPYPWPAPPEDTKWTVAFEPPTDIKLVGSWANKVSVKHRDNEPFGVDLAIELPDVRSLPTPLRIPLDARHSPCYKKRITSTFGSSINGRSTSL